MIHFAIESLKTRVRLKSGPSKKDDRSRPAAPSMDFAQPKPMAAQPRIDEATDAPEETKPEPTRADPRKVADRVYELMKNEMADARTRGGAGRKR